MADIGHLSRDVVRRAGEAAEATFREVVAQGPEKTLGRGFAVVQTADGRLITSASAAAGAAQVKVKFQDGSVDASVRPDRKDHP